MTAIANDLQKLYQNRELLWLWTIRSVRIRYKQSVLGGVWAVMQPLSLMVVFSIVFTYFVEIDTGDIPYPIFSYTALLPWTLFAASMSFGLSSLVSNLNLVTKISFPREILPIAEVAANLVDFMIAAIIFIGMIFFYRVEVSVTLLIAPFLLLIQLMLTLGIVFFFSAINVFYRDFRFIVPLGVQLWMYASPIIYPVSLVPERFLPIYMLNPMVGIIESYRAVVLRGDWPDWTSVLYASIIAALLLILGYIYFKHVEWEFADII